MTSEPSPNLAQIVAGVHRLAQAAQRINATTSHQHGGKDCCGGFPKPGCCTPSSPPRQGLLPPLQEIVQQHRDADCCRVGACCNVPDV